MRRIFDGDPKVPLRKGFKKIYGHNAEQNIKKFDTYDGLMEDCAKNKDIEAIVIALPLCMHAKAAIDAMKIGKERGKPIHVLCEKLMAWNIAQCKQMIRTAKETGSILSIGHQRHYSMLYAHAIEVVNAGVLGDIRTSALCGIAISPGRSIPRRRQDMVSARKRRRRTTATAGSRRSRTWITTPWPTRRTCSTSTASTTSSS